MESARLRRQAERAAVLEERGRLARGLHDSVTQLLYSLGLYAATGQRFAGAGEIQGAEDYLGVLAGFTTIIVGIFLLNAFKEVPISLSTLNVRVKRDPEPVVVSDSTTALTANGGSWDNRHDETRVKLLDAIESSEDYDERNDR